MPTIRGWGALGASVALMVLWIAFGESLLLAAAGFLAAAVGFGVWYVRRVAPRTSVRRHIIPQQLADGDRAMVTVSLVAERPLSHVHVTDTIEGLGSAEFVADQVVAGNPLVGRYEVLCRPRGVYRVGPTDVRIRDPFGMAESGGTTGRIDRMVVFPAVDALKGLPLVRGQDPNQATARAHFSQTGGEDFFTMREYQQGDDLRRVHWPTSARRDTLMIRQLEMPWQSRALVILDPEASSYPGADLFEHAVRGAASAVHHLFTTGFSPTLWTGRPSAVSVTTSASYTLAMEELATVSPTEGIDLRHGIARLRQHSATGGALVLITGQPSQSHLTLYQAIGRDYGRVIVLATTDEADDTVATFRRSGAVTVLAPRGTDWGDAWTEAMEHTWSIATPG